MFQVTRYHDICAGHRVAGHEGKCRHLHGHNYRIHFTCEADTKKCSRELCARVNSEGLDDIGRVIDFSVIKEKLCMWLEDKWDHKFLAWDMDHIMREIHDVLHDDGGIGSEGNPCGFSILDTSVVWVPFNPTAENLAEYLVTVVGPMQLEGTGVKLVKVLIEETAKCSASYEVQNETD